MISVFGVLGIIGCGAAFAALVVSLCQVRRLENRFERLREHCDGRIDTLRQSVELLSGEGEVTNGTLAEARRKALEAERRFTEGVTNILSFSQGAAGRKGEGC